MVSVEGRYEARSKGAGNEITQTIVMVLISPSLTEKRS